MYQDDDDEKDYNNLPNDNMMTDPEEEGDVLQQNADNDGRSLGAAKDVNVIPDSPLADGNIDEVNSGIEDTAEEA